VTAGALTVESLLEQERAELDRRLAAIAADPQLNPPGPLQAPIQYAVAGGGKRLRGALCLLAYRAVHGAGGPGVYDVACAIELVHTYSLVHDDLPCMDDDDLRRGRATVHRVFGVRAAALAGAALIPLAFRVLGRAGAPRPKLPLALARGIGAGGMVGGQWLDLAAEGRELELAGLAGIHAAKTGALFEASLAMGGIAAGATREVVAALASFGAALGLAFQVVDDLLDETGDSAALGKTAGKDRRQQKATYPALLGQEAARARARGAVAQGVARLRAAGIASVELAAAGEWVLARDH
jgi:geranylgeranyl pyrophosphate synthase